MQRVGIIGTGQMAATMLEAMCQTSDLSPVAVLSGSAQRAAQFAQAFGLEAAFDDQAAFLGSGLDMVYIANANAGHGAAALACVEAGLPIFVEKPMAHNAPEVVTILERAKAQQVLVLENLWVLALPAYRALKEAALGGQYGDVQALSFDFSLPVTQAQMPGLFAPQGGGVLRDRGVYGLAMALDLLGPVQRAHPDLKVNAAGLETHAAVQMTHDSGALSQITVSFDAVGRNDMALSLEQAALRLGPGLAAEHLSISAYAAGGGRADATAPLSRAGRLKQTLKQQPMLRRLKARRATTPGGFHSYGASPYSPILQELTRCITDGQTQSAIVPWSLSTSVARLVEEIVPDQDPQI